FGGAGAGLGRPRGAARGRRRARWSRPVRPLVSAKRFAGRRRILRYLGGADRGAPRWCRADRRAPRRSGSGAPRAVSLAAALALLALARLDVELAAVDFDAVERGDRLACGLLGRDI